MKFNKVTLANGLRLITVPMPDNPSVTVLVMVEAGSKYETKSESGLSHFLEHMMFKGTPRRPKAINITRELDGIGANYNAFTTHEFTGYYAKSDRRHFDKILEVVSDLYLNPLFESAEIEKEKGVIVEEIRMYQDLPQRHVHFILAELLYGDTPAGWNVAGTIDNVRSFRRQNFLDYRAKHYVSSATTVIVAGSIDEEEARQAVEKSFLKIPDSPKSAKEKVKESQQSPQIKTEFKETDQTHLVIANRSFGVFDDKMPVMQILVTILGKGMSSRLFSKMRDEMGICYYVGADHDVFTDHGYLAISAGVENSRVKEAVGGIIRECERLKHEAVDEAELQKVKDFIAGSTMLELETSEARAEFCGYQETIKKKIELPEELIKKTNQVTSKDIMDLAREIFVNEGLNMAVVGRFKDGSELTDSLKYNS